MISMTELQLAPGFLIAMPQLGDPNFNRTVVLMLHHDEQGAMGLVVNRRTDVLLATFCEQHNLPYGGPPEQPLCFGGPCELQRGFLLHQDPDLAAQSLQIGASVHLSTDVESVKTILRRSRQPYRFLLGYAGWGPGQVEEEIAQGAWLTSVVRSARVFEEDAEGTWAHTLGDLGIDPAQLLLSTERH
jgi:putative transcriptional regulator